MLFPELCRFCTTGLPSDVTVEVGDMSFHLHKVIVLTITIQIVLFYSLLIINPRVVLLMINKEIMLTLFGGWSVAFSLINL